MLEDRTYRNIRDSLVNFLRAAESPELNLVPPGYFQTHLIKRPELEESLKATCPAADLAKIFAVIGNERDETCLSIAKDAGVRTFEIPRLRRKYFCKDEKMIKLPGFDADGTQITKTGLPRWIPIQPRLMARLGWVFDIDINKFPDFRICRVVTWSRTVHEYAEAAKVVLGDNWVRHGFGTHRLKLTNDLGLVSREMGNSVEVVVASYAREVDEKESIAWFDV